MASTRRLTSGRYQGRYRDAAGVELSAGMFTQEAQALREAGRREAEARDGIAVDARGGKITWGAWFDDWHESRTLAFATDENYRSVAGNHIMPTWSRTKLIDIKPMAIERWKKAMLTPPRRGAKAPCSPWVVRSALMLFKTSLNAAVLDKRLKESPAKPVSYPDLPEGLERYLTPDEVEAITFYLDGPNALLVRLGVETGLRFGEIAGLHWHRVDLRRGVIQVVEKFDQKARVIDPLPKDKEQRTVPLPPDLVGQLIRYRDHAAPLRRRGPVDGTCGIPHAIGECRGEILFRGARGAPLKSNDWGKTIWKTALALAGIEGRVRPHDMRHTYASWLIQEGVQLPDLARVMGHSDWEVTRRYAHLSDEGFDKVREALSRHRGVTEPMRQASPAEMRLLDERLAVLEAAFAQVPGTNLATYIGGLADETAWEGATATPRLRATGRATDTPPAPLYDATSIDDEQAG
jgi:integrase